MIVTIDGPAGAGKSSAAKALAQRLGYRFLDTGAMYRAVALAALTRGHDFNQPEALVELARGLRIELEPPRVFLDGADVTAAIREVGVTAATHYAADNPGVREVMVQRQRTLAAGRDVVTEGRDQGTVVFPDAECKVFLTATPQERARRRWGELKERGEHVDFDEVLSQQTVRDRRDETRECGPLKKAADAIELLTDGLSEAEVVNRLEQLVRACRA
jgi:cytidylate kinase